jgi:hypothetical protein
VWHIDGWVSLGPDGKIRTLHSRVGHIRRREPLMFAILTVGSSSPRRSFF